MTDRQIEVLEALSNCYIVIEGQYVISKIDIDAFIEQCKNELSTPSDKSSMEEILSNSNFRTISEYDSSGGSELYYSWTDVLKAMSEHASNQVAKATAELNQQIRTQERLRLEDAHSHIQDQIMSNDTTKALRKENEELKIMNDALQLAASWVSVEEKGLPFVDDYYLCYYSNEMDSGTAIMYYAPRIEHEWHHITHWQPLTENPKQ